MCWKHPMKTSKYSDGTDDVIFSIIETDKLFIFWVRLDVDSNLEDFLRFVWNVGIPYYNFR